MGQLLLFHLLILSLSINSKTTDALKSKRTTGKDQVSVKHGVKVTMMTPSAAPGVTQSVTHSSGSLLKGHADATNACTSTPVNPRKTQSVTPRAKPMRSATKAGLSTSIQ